MAVELELRPLAKSDDRSRFTCGEPAIDRFFEHYAGQNQFKLHLAVTYVAVARERIMGFATVAVGAIERATLPAPLQARLPAYPLPVLRLARLGVDTEAHGLGVGRQLVGHVLRLALAQRDSLGCVGVVTDAKPGAEAFYARFGFKALDDVREGTVQGAPVAMFLDIRTVEAAAKH